MASLDGDIGTVDDCFVEDGLDLVNWVHWTINEGYIKH